MSRAAVGLKIGLSVGIVVLLAALASVGIASARTRQAAAIPTPTVQVKASVAPGAVDQLDRLTVATGFSASAEVAEPLRAYLEIGSTAGGNSVLAMSQSGFRIPRQGSRDVYWVWRVPDRVPPGKYAVSVKVEGVNTGLVYGTQDQAATFEVAVR